MENTLPDKIPPEARLMDDDALIRLGALAEWYQSEPESLLDPAPVATCLGDTDHAVRRLAVAVLARFGERAVPALVLALDPAQPPEIRIAGAGALGSLGPVAAPAMAPLCDCLSSEDDLLRWHAGFALSRIGPAAVPSLQGMMASSDPSVLSSVLTTLEWMGTGAREAVESIGARTGHPDPRVRLAGLSALVKVTDDPDRGLSAMLSMLAAEEDPAVRGECLERIGHLGPLARDARESILACFSDSAGGVRAAAALAMARIRADFATSEAAWLALLADPDEDVRASAALAVGAYGPAAAATIPTLETMVREDVQRPAAIAAAVLKMVLPS